MYGESYFSSGMDMDESFRTNRWRVPASQPPKVQLEFTLWDDQEIRWRLERAVLPGVGGFAALVGAVCRPPWAWQLVDCSQTPPRRDR